MRNPADLDTGTCPLCRVFLDPERALCRACASQPNHLDAIVPITYALRGGPIYKTLREYKNARLLRHGTYATIRVAAILTRFLEFHEHCLATVAGVDRFDLVTTVPSGTPDRDETRANLRSIAAWSAPTSDRYDRLLRPTGRGRWGRAYDPTRYEPIDPSPIENARILLLDDLWVTGGHAQSAAHTLRTAGATTIALVAVGRYLRPDWPAGEGSSCAHRLAASTTSFDPAECAVHLRAPASTGLPTGSPAPCHSDDGRVREHL
jgi:predicted amidophosphoribosyltransferase